MRNIILDIITPKLPVKKRVPKWYEKGMIYTGIGIMMLFFASLALLFLAVSIWAIKFIWGSF